MLTDYFIPHIGGGVERVVYEICRRLVEMGHYVEVISLNTKSAPESEIMEGFKVHRASVIQLTELIGVQSSFSLHVLPLALRIAKNQSFDIIHAHNLFFFTTIMALILKRWLKKPLVVTMHLGSLEHIVGIYKVPALIYLQSVGRLILHQSERIIAVSQAVSEHAQKLGVPQRNLRVIPNGVDLEKFQPNCHRLFTRDHVNVVFIGRLIFNKGPQYIVEAAPTVLKEFPHVKFKFIGDGPLRKDLEQRVKNLKLESVFEFVGLKDNIPALLQDADLLVRPSLLEGMPLAVLEAMACGLPVVATSVGGTAELIDDKVNGLLIEPANSAQLAAGLLEVLKNPGWGRQMGQMGREKVEQSYNWNQIAAQTVSVYRELVGE